MPKPKSESHARPKHPDVQRAAMDDIKELEGSSTPIHNEIQYREPNRDRALGDADRTGRHFDEEVALPAPNDAEASKDHEADQAPYNAPVQRPAKEHA